MRPLVVAAACLLSLASAQGVTRVEPALDDLIRLLGDVTVLEVEVPEGAKTLRTAETMGERGYTESYSRIDRGEVPVEGGVIRFLIKAPGHLPVDGCEGEQIDIHLVWPDGQGSHAAGYCVPPPGGEPGPSSAKHEYSLTGAELELGVWTPIYVRAWTWVRAGDFEAAVNSRYLDPEHAFTLQLMFLEDEIEDVRGGPPPLDAEALRRVPELAPHIAPPETAAPREP